jgi:hypothetical protein
MKTYFFKSLLALSMIAFLFSGCDKLEEADDVTFNATFTGPQVEVHEEGDVPANPYMSLISSIDAEQSAEYVKYKDKIKKIRVNKITYTISDLAAPGAVTLVNGTATFFENGGVATSGEIASIQNLLLVNGSGELEATQDALDAISAIFLENGEVFVVSAATVSDAPVFFHIGITLEVSITANALD